MQHPSSREMQAINGSSPQPQIPLPDQPQQHYDASSAHDDFDQMLSNLSTWPELSQGASGAGNQESPWDLSGGGDESLLLASRLRHHQIGGKPAMGLQQVMVSPMARSAADSGLIPLPLSLGSADSAEVDAFKTPNTSSGDGLYNGFGASLQRVPAGGQQPFSHPQKSYGAPTVGMGQGQSVSGGASVVGTGTGTIAPGSGTAPPRQRVRARRGQATDPHSIAERQRRERIAERMKALQELVPNANKTDKASMLDEIIDYVKFLQLQVKVLSMSRLGGAAAVAPLVADMSSEGPGGGGGRSGGAAPGGNDSLSVTEHQVAKMMEEDMGSAMQYLQGKGLCLMPISLASAISTTTGHPRSSPLTHRPVAPAVAAAPHHHSDGPTSPSVSVITAQSAMAAGEADRSRRPAKDASNSISKS